MIILVTLTKNFGNSLRKFVQNFDFKMMIWRRFCSKTIFWRVSIGNKLEFLWWNNQLAIIVDKILSNTQKHKIIFSSRKFTYAFKKNYPNIGGAKVICLNPSLKRQVNSNIVWLLGFTSLRLHSIMQQNTFHKK